MAVAGRRGLPPTIVTSATPSTGGLSAHAPALAAKATSRPTSPTGIAVTTVTATAASATVVITARATAVAPATVTPVTTAVTPTPAVFGIGDGRIEHCMRHVQFGQERHNQHREDRHQQDPRDSPHCASLLGE